MSVQRFQKSNADQQPTHIYYDMNLINNDSSFPALPVRFQYKETRSNYYLQSPQDYYMSIVRFYLQTPTLPCFIPQINLNTNGNFGGTYPIQSMSGATNVATNFQINLYTPIPVVAGAVIYVGYSGGFLTNQGADVATGNNYYRVISTATNLAGFTELTVRNDNPVGGPAIPQNYIGGNTPAFSVNGGTQYVEYANLDILARTFVPATSELTINITPASNPFSLISLFVAGDKIFINNGGLLNGTYTVKTVLVNSLVLEAPQLVGVVLPPYTPLSASFTSSGDFYNVTSYRTTLQFTNSVGLQTFTVPVVYLPEDATQAPPVWNPTNNEALSLTEITGQYYYIYNYNTMMTMVNYALTNAFWGLNGSCWNSTAGAVTPPLVHMTGAVAGPATVNNYQSPTVSWNLSNATILVQADNNAFNNQVQLLPIYLYFNQALSTLFDTFPYVYPDVRPESPLYSYINFNLSYGAGLYIVQTYSPVGVTTKQYTAIQQYQQNTTAGLFNPVQSIVFSSTLLPVVMENVGLPLILNGTSPNNIQVGSSANVFPIVTDFQVGVNATSGYISDINYVPPGEYRLVDLYGKSPANQIDIQVFWKDNYGLIHPFLVGSGCVGNMKILFRKKNYNNIDLDDL
jgi:hypothetical protein